MSSPKNPPTFSGWISVSLLPLALGLATLTGCGVKGDPLPPEQPAELGRGRPTYKRATESLKIENARTVDQPKRPVKPRDDDDDDDDKKDDQ